MICRRVLPAALAAVLLAGLSVGGSSAAEAAPHDAPVPYPYSYPPAGDPFVVQAVPLDGTETGYPSDLEGVEWTDTRTGVTGVIRTGPFVDELNVSPDGAYIAYIYHQSVDDVDVTRMADVSTRTGVITQLPDGQFPTFGATGDTVSFVASAPATATDPAENQVDSVPATGGPVTYTGVTVPSALMLAIAGDGSVISNGLPGTDDDDDPCDLVKTVPQGPSTCLLTSQALAQATAGLEDPQHVYVARVTSTPGTSTLALSIQDYGTSDPRTVIATLSLSGQVDVLSSTDTRLQAGGDVSSAIIDPSGTEVLYADNRRDSNDDLTTTIESVDLATGTHEAPVHVQLHQNDNASIAAYLPPQLPTLPSLSPHAAAPAASPTAQTPSVYVPLVKPVRFVDTRSGLGAAKRPVSSAAPIAVDVATSSTGVPSDATAVVMNLTGTAATKNTFLRAYPPTASPAPPVSDVTLVPGQTAAAGVTVALSDGKLRIGTAAGTTEVIGDVSGYYLPLATAGSAGDTYVPLPTPQRVLDSRSGGLFRDRFGPGQSSVWTPTTAAVPAGATAVVLEVTGTGGGAATAIAAVPGSSTGVPTTSTLNVPAFGTATNVATVTLSASRTIRFSNAAGIAKVTAQLVGYYLPGRSGSLFVPLPPSRVYDSRNGTNTVGGAPKRLGPGSVADARGAGAITTGSGDNTVAPGATAIVDNLTVVGATTATTVSLSATPATGTSAALPAAIDVARGQTVSTGSLTPVGSDEQVQLWNAAGTVDAAIDISGYFVPAS